MIKLLHSADLHPNAAGTLAGKTILDDKTGHNVTLTDLRRSLDFMTSVALDPQTRCHAALLPGDLWDSPRPHANEVRVIREAVVRLSREMPVLCIAGNHDVSNNAQDASALECLKNLDNVYVFDRPGDISLRLNKQPVNFFCLPYPRKSQILTMDAHKDKSSEELTAIINQALTAILRGFGADIEEGIPNILLAHGSVANCQVNDQPRSLAGDILLPLDELSRFDFAALGHIHQGQSLNDAGTVWYSGSLMRNGFGEEHEPKGFNLVSIEAGQPAHVVFIHNPHARVYRTLKAVDLTERLIAATLPPDIVWRFKDQLSPDAYQAIKPILDELQATTPFFQVDVELISEDRARDAGMAQCLTMESALTRALAGTIEDAELPSIFEKHRTLVQEVAA